MKTRPPAVRCGFTLMEILIVVVILGVLAAIVIPSFASATEDTRKAAFAQDLRGFEAGILRYEVDHSQFPPDGGSGSVPLGLEPYVNAPKWESGSPIGGVWDNETDDVVTAGIGIHFNGTGQTRDSIYMTEIDRMIDDGVVTTGSFRAFGDRYYRVIVP
ncbi:MAG: prepilin-type N-terminal cleavage/methylation domain-containing protein [Phycisphaeraceae bacterium]|nr:prepilin-type N-terminal cleavage/methylation domain-containing protein [Phycisphaeraceae bacterium]